MNRFLAILAMLGLSACTTTTTGGAGGGTTGTTTTVSVTVSVPCTDCLSQSVSWGPSGGLVQWMDGSSLSACRTYQHTRTPAYGEPADAGSPSCSVEIGGCDAGTGAVHDVEQALAHPDVTAALAASVPLYGTDRRPCDGSVLSITVGSKSIDVGGDCGAGGGCYAGQTCVPIPPGVNALANVLWSVDQEALKQGDCATVFP